MKEPITPDEMRAIEERAERMGVSRLLLMENAGKAVADYIDTRINASRKKMAVIAGTGNNGGDGFVAARHLAAYGASVAIFLIGTDTDIKTEEASRNWKVVRKMDKSIEIVSLSDKSFMNKLKHVLSEADVVVDAIFGTGVKRELKDPHASVIEMINTSRALKIAVDVPSGLDSLTGEVRSHVVKADATVTFHREKKGLLERKDIIGELVVANIGIPPEADRE